MNALFVLCGVGVVSLLAEIANIRRGLSAFIIAGLAVATFLVTADWNNSIGYYNNMVVFDNFSIVFSALISLVTICWYGISYAYFTDTFYKTDRSALLIFAVIAAYLMVSYNNMAILFLGIEILSICMYVLAGSKKNSFSSNEAAFKYFLMGSFATGFLLFGIALVYGATASFDITTIGAFLKGNPELPTFFYAGVLLIFMGMAFKMSAVPFHFWAPDVYEGAPTNITAFMATVVKIASVGAFYKMFLVCFASVHSPSAAVIEIILLLTLVVGNLSAVQQSNVKRILAFSSVGHIGYILLGMLTGSGSAPVVYYYLTAYSFATISAFGVLLLLEKQDQGSTLGNFGGLFFRNPLMAITMILALLSLAGIPPLAGFFAKYMVFGVAIESGFIGLVIVAIVTSLIGVFYYFKIIRAMVVSIDGKASIRLELPQKVLLIALILINLGIGLFPDPIIKLLSVH
jgi:NADH-quinone oxidoreductase subunit N